MIDFEGVKLVDEEQCFVMPQCDTYFLTEGMRRAGIDFKAYSSNRIENGEGPIGYDEAFARSCAFFDALGDDHACTTDFPCVIVSRVAEEDMLPRARSLFVDVTDPDIIAHREQIARRGQDISDDASYESGRQQTHCKREVYMQLAYPIEEWGVPAQAGEERLFTALLDPNLYEAEPGVVGRGPYWDHLTCAFSIYGTTQCCIRVRKTADEEQPIDWMDAWPDIYVTTSYRAEDISLETLRGSSGYQGGSFLYKAFMERTIKPEHHHFMSFNTLPGGGPEVISLPIIEEERLLNVAIFEDRTGLMVNEPRTHEAILSEFSALQESLGGGRTSIVNLDIPEVRALFAERYPETDAVLTDLRSMHAAITEAAAREFYEREMREGTALEHANEDFFLPMYYGLYFPKRPEGENVIPYDAPEAEPYLQTLTESGWEGQTWIEVPAAYRGGSRVNIEGDPEAMAMDVFLQEEFGTTSESDSD